MIGNQRQLKKILGCHIVKDKKIDKTFYVIGINYNHYEFHE